MLMNLRHKTTVLAEGLEGSSPTTGVKSKECRYRQIMLEL
jgi:hypothetical protein